MEMMHLLLWPHFRGGKRRSMSKDSRCPLKENLVIKGGLFTEIAPAGTLAKKQADIRGGTLQGPRERNLWRGQEAAGRRLGTAGKRNARHP